MDDEKGVGVVAGVEGTDPLHAASQGGGRAVGERARPSHQRAGRGMEEQAAAMRLTDSAAWMLENVQSTICPKFGTTPSRDTPANFCGWGKGREAAFVESLVR